MSNLIDYKNFVRSFLPAGMASDEQYYFVNGKRFTNFIQAEWYLNYITKFGYSTGLEFLFTNNEPGVWYDPSDVANLDWRRNLLTETENFAAAVWIKGAPNNSSVTVNATTAPDGTVTADKLVVNNAAAAGFCTQNKTFTSGTTYTLSIYAKIDDGPVLVALTVETRAAVNINLSTGETTTTAELLGWTVDSAVRQDVGGGWYRCCATMTAGDTVTEDVRLAEVREVGDGTIGIFFWGAQLELGSTATAYQPITTLDAAVRSRFPKATLYQDTAGTSPVTTAGQTVALALDKHEGLTLGPNIGTNNDATLTASGSSSATYDGENYTITRTADGNGEIRFVVPTTGLIRIDIEKVSGNDFLVRDTSTVVNTVSSRTTALFSFGTGSLRINQGAVGQTSVIKIHSVKLLPGNHATQATAAARPTYGYHPFGGVRNLLRQTENFADAAWIKSSGTNPSITGGIDAPDGTNTASTIDFDGVSGLLRQSLSTMDLTSQLVTTSVWFRARTATTIRLNLLRDGGTVAAFTDCALTSEWQRFDVSAVMTSATATPRFRIQALEVGSVDVWGAQLELGALSDYQRVGNQYDVTEAGVPLVHYLRHDGTDDFMVTPTITPGTDKVQVFSGVRKLSDAARGAVIEHSDDPAGRGGIFGISAPLSSVGKYYGFSGNNTSLATVTSSTEVAPDTAIISIISDKGGDFLALRVDGTQVDTSAADQGTGDFLTYSMYIGSRAGTSLFFNGNQYQLIGRFGPNLDADTIARAEAEVAQKTGIVL